MFKFADYRDCVIKKSGQGKSAKYYIVSMTQGPICCINLPEYGRAEDVLAIKDYSENEGIVEWLENNRLIIGVVDVVFSGFVSIPIVKVDTERLMSL